MVRCLKPVVNLTNSIKQARRANRDVHVNNDTKVNKRYKGHSNKLFSGIKWENMTYFWREKNKPAKDLVSFKYIQQGSLKKDLRQ